METYVLHGCQFGNLSKKCGSSSGRRLRSRLSQHFSAGGCPFGGYHRSCYQTYTNKTFLARLQRDESNAESENNEGDASPTCDDRSLGSNDADPHPITIRSGVPSTDLKKCIICQGEKTFVHK